MWIATRLFLVYVILQRALLVLCVINSLTEEEMEIAKPIIEGNDFSDIRNQTNNDNILRVLQYYCITREDAEQAMAKNK